MKIYRKKNNAIKMIIAVLFFFIFSLETAFGVEFFRKIYESFIATDANKLELAGTSYGGQFGASLARGDFNGDGVEDLLVGAPFASVKGKTWNGAVRVIFGLDANEDLYFFGENAGDQLGTSLATGDYNNDGVIDIAMGAYKAEFDNIRPGKVFVMYGGNRWNKADSQSVDFALEKPDVELSQGLDGAGFGVALKTLDVNNDSVDDILVGAPYANTSRYIKGGMVYGYFGSQNFDKNHDLTFDGQQANSRFGAVISDGYITDDKYTDVLISAYYADDSNLKEAGKVYFYDGINIGSANNAYTKVFVGRLDKGWFGFSMDTGDINDDLNEEVAISYFPYKGSKELSKVLIFKGGDNLTVDIPIINIADPLGESLFGASVLLEDINGDGRGEILIGAPGVNQLTSLDSGDVYIIYADENGEFLRNYSVKNNEVDSMIHGENPDDWFGYSLEVMDLNNDGKKDLVIGSRYSDSANSINDGKVFVMWGNNAPYGSSKPVFQQTDIAVNRGEFIKIVVDSFDVRTEKADVINSCYQYKDFCLFNFMLMSTFDGITLEPEVILYPDVSIDSAYYEEITLATMLGLVNGYINDESSPFRPDVPISRIQALKVILGTAELVPPKYQFELVAMLGSYEELFNQKSYFEDVDSKISYMWWYPRYINYAVENDIIDDGDYFRPEDNISVEELDDIISRTLKFIDSRNEETDA